MIQDAIEIIRATRDGNELAPLDLWLVQEAVNGHLNELGKSVFRELLEKVRAGTYLREAGEN